MRNLEKLTRRKMLVMAAASGFAGLAGGVAHSATSNEGPASQAYRLLILAARPAGYWRLGERSGVVAADKTKNHHDAWYMKQPKMGAPGAISGDSNSSITLDGKSYVEIPDHPAFSQPTSGAGLTVEVWMRPDKLDFADTAAVKYIHWLGKGEERREEWGFRFYTRGDSERPNRISAYIWNPSGQLGAGAYFQDRLVAGKWIHVVACYEPGNATVGLRPAGVCIYKDGVFRQGPPSRGTLYSNPPDWKIMPQRGTAPVRLGTRDGKGFLVGGLDEVAIYPRVLSPEEIRWHYEVGTSMRKLSAIELGTLRGKAVGNRRRARPAWSSAEKSRIEKEWPNQVGRHPEPDARDHHPPHPKVYGRAGR